MAQKYDDPAVEAKYQRLLAAKKLEKIELAQDDMLHFSQLMAPDPEEPDCTFSRFEATPLARMLCQIIEKVDRGELTRVAVSVGPQMGKSQVLSRNAPSWLSGRHPERHMILGTYNDTFAKEFGGDVQSIMQSEEFHRVFPDHAMRKGSEAKDLLITEAGGKMAFVGVGGSGTGKPADFFFVDDPIKSDEDAQSALFREKLWKWFTSTTFSRCHNRSAVIVVHTRWHEDDLIGRLCDPDHPERNKRYKGVAERWNYYNLPAIVEDPVLAKALGLTLETPQDPIVREQFGVKPMASLWEARKSLSFLAEAKELDPHTFSSLYMGKPAPDEGIYFRVEDMVEYNSPEELPKNLNKYGASDHAVSEKQRADSTVLGCAGVDDKDDIWILPDIVWGKMETDDTVDEIINQMKTHKPEVWWAENDVIQKAFGPFLKLRMHEERVYTTLDPKTPSKSKATRARSIQGRMRMKKVHFPAFAPWWQDAKAQLLKFPYGTNDDFVDFISWIGLGLTQEYGAEAEKKENPDAPKVGTIQWIKAATSAQERRERIKKAAQGW